jgi:1,4-alpha-glucan branching enzyme
MARHVTVCGSFNGWRPGATPLSRDAAGHWQTTVALAPGRYEYKFVVDGEWLPDVHASQTVLNQYGTLNSVLQVRAPAAA